MFDLCNVLLLRFHVGFGSVVNLILTLTLVFSFTVANAPDARILPSPCRSKDFHETVSTSDENDSWLSLPSSRTRSQMFNISELSVAEGHMNSELTCDHRQELLMNFSQASSAFIECAVLGAKPIRFCEQCVCEFHITQIAWNDIQQDEDCKEDILVSDRLQIVSQTHTFVVSLWNDGFCEKCYKHFQPTNTTTEFLQKFNETKHCFMQFGGFGEYPDSTINDTMCTNCSQQYDELNKYYDYIGDENFCMDIIDRMNRTRIEWKEHGCNIHVRDLMSVMALTSFVCVLPVFFYLTAKFHGTKKLQKLVQKSDSTAAVLSSSRLYAGTTATLR